MTDNFNQPDKQGNNLENNPSNYLDNQMNNNGADINLDNGDTDLPQDVFNQADLEEETAAEVSPVVDYNQPTRSEQHVPEMGEQEVGGNVLGWTALVLSILALFFFPVLLGASGAITGFFAYRNGTRALGVWSIAIGLFAMVMGLFLLPYFVR